LSTQNYLKGPVLEEYREYRINAATFEDSGDYIVQVQTQFDSDVKVVNLVIQDRGRKNKFFEIFEFFYALK